MNVKSKLRKWLADVEGLPKIVITQPQAAFAALTRSLQCEWNYLQQIVLNCGALIDEVKTSLSMKFFPSVLGSEVTEVGHDLFLSQHEWVD